MSDVYVYIYDISKGFARSMSQALLGRQIEGVWHTGIVAYGLEWFFGSAGISNCPPCGTILGQPEQKQFQGRTAVSYEDFYSYIVNLSQTTFKGSDYHLLKHNCNNFSDQVSEFLTGRKIPAHITGLPQEVLSTPFGQMLMPMLEQMSVNPGSGNTTSFGGPAAPPPPPSQMNHNAAFSTSSASVPTSSSSSASASSTSAASKTLSGKSVTISPSSIEAAASTLQAQTKDQDIKTQLEEIKEYCLLPVSQTADWSLGRPHLYLLTHLASPASTPTTAAACDLLAAMISREELVPMATRDPKRRIQALTIRCDQEHEAIRIMANLTQHSSQRQWLLRPEEPLIKEQPDSPTGYLVLTQLVGRLMEGALSEPHAQHLAVLLYNTCLGLLDVSKSGEKAEFVSSAALELTTPLLEFFMYVPSNSSTSCIETLLEAMDILANISNDVKELSKCYGVDVEKIRGKAPNAKKLAQNLFG